MPKRKISQREQNPKVELENGHTAQGDSKPRPRRCTRSIQSTSEERSLPSENDSDPDLDINHRPRKVVRRTLSHVNVTGPAFPRSIYDGFEPPLALSTEMSAVPDLKMAFDKRYASMNEKPEYTYFTLNDFSIYLPNRPRHAYELTTLDKLQNRGGFSELLFDGILNVGTEKRYVSGVRFRTMAIDGYGDPHMITLDGRICIQSPLAHGHGVWYKLGEPSQEYQRFYRPFLWLAQFTKYFVDYLLEMNSVTLNQLGKQFSAWLKSRYRDNPDFLTWFDGCNRLRDFGTTIAAHVGFLWKECYSIDDRESGLCTHPIWGEVDPLRLDAITEHDNIEKKTIVTPFVYECFKRMYFQEHLEVRHVSDERVLEAVAKRNIHLKLTPFGASQAPDVGMHTPMSMPESGADVTLDVRKGDVICVKPDSKGHWKTSSSTWYAYVQAVRQKSGGTVFDVIWLYEPADTTLGTAYYPFANELFMSDNCDCGKTAVEVERVIGKADVNWFANGPREQSGLFVRQTYRTTHDEDTYDFVSLQQTDFKCRCTKRIPIFEECRSKHKIDDYVLVQVHSQQLGEDILDPAQVVEFIPDRQRVVLRRLERKSQRDPAAPTNEVLITDELISLPPSRVIRKCHVRCFDARIVESGLPTLYDRGGAGDFFYVMNTTGTGTSDGGEEDMSATRTNTDARSSEPTHNGTFFDFTQTGPNATGPKSLQKLKGMGIFCGGGNLDRGLEDGGCVDFRYAIDWAERAIHTYRANAADQRNVQYFWGSVNDYLAQAIAGSTASCIAGIGDVELVSAGSPCPGFSTMQPDKQSETSLRNASMVASVVSYVDLYCPQYCFLENVVSMTHGMGMNKDENVFAQILAAFVALGYQVQQFLMESWNYGSPQSRSRVFIVASAPGLAPLRHPPHTHAHPSIKKVEKSLGRSSNGRIFGFRRDYFTPFQHVSPVQATRDLPNISDSQSQLCLAFPDHRTPSEESSDSRARITSVPVLPRGMGLVQAAGQGQLSGEALDYYERLGKIRKRPESRVYARVYPNELFPAVTTALQIACGAVGRSLHWCQHRTLTVMELRRAQGFPDSEVIIGSPKQQVVIIGNSVDRKVAFALGMSLRESWTASAHLQDASVPLGSSKEMSPHAVDGEAFQQELPNLDHRFTLSQEEKNAVLADPKHGFRVIRQILDNRRSKEHIETRNSSDTNGLDLTTELQTQAPQRSIAIQPIPIRSQSRSLT